VDGTDAFIVEELATGLDSPEGNSWENRYLKIGILNVTPSTIVSGKGDVVFFELFYKVVSDSRESFKFDPNFRIKFKSTMGQIIEQKGIYLDLPQNITLLDQQALRLDIDGCGGCRLSTTESQLFTTLNHSEIRENRITPIIRNHSGVATVEPAGIKLNLDDWNSNHISGGPSDFKLDGFDPFFVSPPLNISTQNLAGLYFKVRSPFQTSAYQVFYATESHQFIESASSILELPTNKDGVSEFFIPMRFLSEQQPIQNTLNRIRFDIVASDELKPQPWSVEELMVVPHSKFNHYKKYIPARLLQRKQQKSSVTQLLIGSIERVFSDLLFALF
jgi:hypothetical protein